MTEPLEVLYEAGDIEGMELPEPLATWYGGRLLLSGPRLVTNFVATLDGVVAVPALRESNRLISMDSEADRFVMGLLRAYADVVLIGSGTLHAAPHTRWTAEDAFPPGQAAFHEWRHRRGLLPTPLLAVMTATGMVDVDHPALRSAAMVCTTQAGAAALRGRLSAASTLSVFPGTETVDASAVLAALEKMGHQRILSEAGPHVFGSLLAAGLVDDLFLTLSPQLAGRAPEHPRLSLVEGTALLPKTPVVTRIASIRRHGELLFMQHRPAARRPGSAVAGRSAGPPPRA